jgi:hypothetical protein
VCFEPHDLHSSNLILIRQREKDSGHLRLLPRILAKRRCPPHNGEGRHLVKRKVGLRKRPSANTVDPSFGAAQPRQKCGSRNNSNGSGPPPSSEWIHQSGYRPPVSVLHSDFVDADGDTDVDAEGEEETDHWGQPTIHARQCTSVPCSFSLFSHAPSHLSLAPSQPMPVTPGLVRVMLEVEHTNSGKTPSALLPIAGRISGQVRDSVPQPPPSIQVNLSKPPSACTTMHDNAR